MNPEPDSFLSRFKKHYSHYLLGIIVPALINGLSIPIFKNLLGPSAYGQYALYFNALLIVNLLISGWLSQGVLRFYAKAINKIQFTKHVFQLSVIIGSITFLPAVAVVWWQSQNVITGILFGLCLLLAAVQLPLQAVTQSGFLSKAAVSAEAIRTVSWFVISIILIKSGIAFLPSLFGALFISYLLSVLFLYNKNASLLTGSLLSGMALNNTYIMLARYGWPFSLWFILYYLTAYMDKVLMLQHFGPVVQGHYSALFDFLSKSLGLVVAPVTIAAVPLITEAYEGGRYISVNILLKKLVLWEVAALFLLILIYMVGGYKILFYLLHIPYTDSYLYTGLLTISGTMTWQIALLLHKPIELKLRSIQLLKKIGVSIATQLLFYCLPFFSDSQLKYPAGYCLAALMYLVLVSAPVFKGKRKRGKSIKQDSFKIPV